MTLVYNLCNCMTLIFGETYDLPNCNGKEENETSTKQQHKVSSKILETIFFPNFLDVFFLNVFLKLELVEARTTDTTTDTWCSGIIIAIKSAASREGAVRSISRLRHPEEDREL